MYPDLKGLESLLEASLLAVEQDRTVGILLMPVSFRIHRFSGWFCPIDRFSNTRHRAWGQFKTI